MKTENRQSRWITVWLILLPLFLAIKVQGAGFDCNKAKTTVEKMICTDSELSKLDEELSMAYIAALQNEKQPDELRQAQKQWMKERNACKDAQSLAKSYSSRIKELLLKKQTGVENYRDMKVSTPSNVCDYCVQQVNSYKTLDIEIEKIPLNSIDIPIPNDYSEDNFINKIDINNDGVMERIFFEGLGICFSVYQNNKNERIPLTELWGYDWEENKERWVDGWRFIKYQGVTYILEFIEETMSHILYINPHNVMDVVCEFDRREKPLALTKSENDKVCQLILKNQATYVEFDNWFELSREEIERFTNSHDGHCDNNATFMDINNDGNNELVVMLYEQGSRCASKCPVILTADRKSIDIDFMKNFPELGQCGRFQKPFIVGDTVYLDEEWVGGGSGDGYRRILKIDNNKIKTICEFNIGYEYFVKNQKGFADDWVNAMSQHGTDAVEELIKKREHLSHELIIKKKLKPYSRFPIEVALELKRDDILERLLEAGADPNYQEDEEGYSNLAKAVLLGSTQSVSLLLKYGAKDNHSPLSAIEIATEQDSPEKLQLLLKAGMKREDQLKSEIINISLTKLEALIKSGAKIGDEAAIAAIEAKDTYKYERLKLMLKYGLDVNRKYAKHVIAEGITQKSSVVWEIGPEIKTKKIEKTLLQWAKEVGDPEIINIFNRTGTE